MSKNIYKKLYDQATGEGQFANYIDATDVARIVRDLLKKNFPGQKFSVRTSKYSMGASVRASWIDGPTEKEVNAVIGFLAGKKFDGMIDMGSYSRHWLTPSGITFASNPGTEGSRGTISASKGQKPSNKAIEVSLGAHYIFADRDRSDEFMTAILEKVNQEWGLNISLDDWKNGRVHDHDTYTRIHQEAGKTSAYQKPKPKKRAQSKPGANNGGISVEHDRDWTWIHFPDKPAADVRDAIKSLGARWSWKRQAWYIRENVEKSTILATIG